MEVMGKGRTVHCDIYYNSLKKNMGLFCFAIVVGKKAIMGIFNGRVKQQQQGVVLGRKNKCEMCSC